MRPAYHVDSGMSEFESVRVLVHLGSGGRHDYPALVPPLLRRLEAGGFQLAVTTGPGLAALDGHHVLLAASDHPLDPSDSERLQAHLEAGGGVLALHGTLAAWGWSQAGEEGPETELTVRPRPGGPISDRLDPEFPLREALLPEDPPADAQVLVTVPWRYGELAVAYTRRVGDGRLVHLGLGHSAASMADPRFGQLVHRCLRLAAGLQPAPPVGVGLYGYGAIGREHAEAVGQVAGLELRGVCDRASERRSAAAAAHGVSTTADSAQLLADPSVDLVVVGVPPAVHATAVLEALAAGKHVVCEKPFALRVAEVDQMLAAASAAGRFLTVYQSRRWDPDFVRLRAAVAAGAIGELFYMESFIGGYGHPCSYWHSHEPVSGGTIFDWGSHYFDWVLQLFSDPVVAVSATAHKRVWHDVTNSDQVRVDLAFEGGAQATFLQSDIAAAGKPKWYLLGTAGAITGDWRYELVKARSWTGDLVEERLAPSESPAELTVHRPDGHGDADRDRLALSPRRPFGFYRNLADHLLLGEPPEVRAEEAGRNVAVMEAAARSVAAGGARLEVRI